FGLHGKRLDLARRVPGDEHLLARLLNVFVFGGEVAARCAHIRRERQPYHEHQTHGARVAQPTSHGAPLSVPCSVRMRWLSRRTRSAGKLARKRGLNGAIGVIRSSGVDQATETYAWPRNLPPTSGP